MREVKCTPFPSARVERGGVGVIGALPVIWGSSVAAEILSAGHPALGGRVDLGVSESERAVLFCDD